MLRHPAARELRMCSFWAGGISSFPFSRAREYRLLRRLSVELQQNKTDCIKCVCCGIIGKHCTESYIACYIANFSLRWLDIVITKTLLKNREQNRVTIFTRRSRKLIKTK
jgi:hypothetical protein